MARRIEMRSSAGDATSDLMSLGIAKVRVTVGDEGAQPQQTVPGNVQRTSTFHLLCDSIENVVATLPLPSEVVQAFGSD